MKFLLVFILFSSVCVAYAQIEIDKIKIYKKDVPLVIEGYVIGFVFTSLSNQTDLNTIGKQLTGELNRKFGKTWYALTGVYESFAQISFEHEPNTLFWFSFNEKHFYLFKPTLEVETKTVYHSNFTDVIVNARSAEIYTITNRILNETLTTEMMKLIKETLNINPNCDQSDYRNLGPKASDGDSLCYSQLSVHLGASLTKFTGTKTWLTFVGERRSMSAHILTNPPENWVQLSAWFSVGDLLFIVVSYC